ncbi:SGNH/GDSL hydrolase family protein [Agromyces sp. Leaf222]|uniref:SGNH/GDSL hydrolase family protein n=1 Tax=Agromyces sp. Leaf222 TaxID=1735688 RepID=UPI0006F847FB|nr:SGNH/GDSL hydrolase family protein [Agromyces sp. Leaf222]KQM81187.1 hypothetical protein ASE68_15370 [Agromyces sp. Leaf222]
MLVLIGAAGCAAIVAAPIALGATLPLSGAPGGTHSASPSSGSPSPMPSPTPTPIPTPAVTAPSVADLPANARALIVGDSFTEGYGATSASANWATIAASSLGWRATIDGVGGTGFTKTTATDGSTDVGFRQRLLAEARTGSDYDLIVLQGGLNDLEATAEAEYTAVQQAVRAARTQWPDAVVVVFGPAEPIAQGTARLVHLATIRTASESAGAVFIDPSSPRAWITERNSDLLDLGDGLHLNDSGYAYLAARFVAAFLAVSDLD